MTFTAAEFAKREQAIFDAGVAARAPSLAERFVALPAPVREGLIGGLSGLDVQRLLYAWEFWARPKQIAPLGSWVVWLLLGGRGTGKNRTAAEWLRDRIVSGRAKSIVMVGPDWKDTRRYMVGGLKGAGGSGILDVFPPWELTTPRGAPMIEFKETKAEIHFHKYEARAYLNTAEQKELRGANLDTIWADEIIKWKYAEVLWQNIEMTLRDPGDTDPQMVVSTTPMPMALLKALIMDPGTVVTHSVTDENAANVARSWIKRMKRRFGGTRVGLQELEARVLGDNEGALFHQAQIDAHRVPDHPELVRVAIGIDPAVSEKRASDEHGIVAAGIDARGHAYVLADVSGKMPPAGWAAAAVDLAMAHGADWFVVERNKVGDLAAHTIRTELRRRGIESKFEIREAYSIEDKGARASLVVPEYQRGRVHHVGRRLGELESEQTQWNPKRGRSPNRLDALVHGLIELMRLAEKEPEKDAAAAFSGFEEMNRAFARADYNPLDVSGSGSGRSV